MDVRKIKPQLIPLTEAQVKFVELDDKCKLLLIHKRNNTKGVVANHIQVAIDKVELKMTKLLEEMSMTEKNQLLNHLKNKEVILKRGVTRSATKKAKHERYLKKKRKK